MNAPQGFVRYSDRHMGYYDVALICRNGHVANEYSRAYPAHNKKFCDQCGAPTIDTCPSCSNSIMGEYHADGVIGPSFHAPAYCENCGAPFPWTTARVAAAKELARDLPQLTAEEREKLAEAVDDLVTQSPRTPLAESRFKNLMRKAGTEATQAMRGIIVDVVSEAVKKSIF